MNRKPDIDVQKDGRVILRGVAYSKMKAKLRDLANSCCEKCSRHLGRGEGDVEHPNGRGGGRRDDRIFVDGKRNLYFWCRECHSPRHSPLKVCPPKPTESEFNELLGLVE